MRKRPNLENGTVFLVPLETGQYAVGVLVRACGYGGAYGLFFGPALPQSPRVDFSGLGKQIPILSCKFGDYGLHTGRWVVIGSIPSWSKAEWPLPKFWREHDEDALCYISEYDDDLNFVSERITDRVHSAGLPEEAQFGSGIVERKLSAALL